MPRLIIAFLLLLAGLCHAASAVPADGLPARPKPFKFVNDQAGLLAPADAKKLEGGLRHYADETGTQVVVVTVPTLGGRDVADYGRALGNAWGVGQRGKNNGIVVVVGAKEHQITIQAGSGLRSSITPEVTTRVLNQQMKPSFKQGNYFAGLREGLNTLMLAANPSSDPRKQAAAAAGATTAAAAPAAAGSLANASPNDNATPAPPSGMRPLSDVPPAEPTPSGPGLGTLLLGGLAVVALLWLVVRMFRRSSPAPTAPANTGAGTPNFYPNPPSGPAGGYGGPAPANYGGAPNQGGGLMGGGMGGILATGAAAAAGAYLGNRMASGHETETGTAHNLDAANSGAGAAGAAGTGAAGDYFASRNAGGNSDAPDYFSGNDTAANDSSGDYFSSDNSSYDDTSSDDTGGGGFDSTDNSSDSGSW